MKNFMLSWVKHEKSFITSGPEHSPYAKSYYMKLLNISIYSKSSGFVGGSGTWLFAYTPNTAFLMAQIII